MKYKITVLGNIGQGNHIFEINCDTIIYENECITFRKRMLIISKEYKDITILSVPQNCSIIELISIELNE